MSKLSYKKLIDLGMMNNELIEKTNISKNTFYKLKQGDSVATDILLKICNTLNCNIADIVERVEDE